MKTIRIAIIMAGGAGERFWPLSRLNRPKQLLKLTHEDQSLLAEAVNRITPLIPAEQVFIATGRHLVKPIREAKLGIPDENIIAEPCKRNTAGCLCFAAATARHRFGEQQDISMAVITADHRIGAPDKFRATVLASLQAAEQNDALVTIGIHPTRAETGYGYIEIDPESSHDNEQHNDDAVDVFSVVRFLEKPDAESAQRFLATGRYLWNSGMFFWKVSTFMQQLEKARPDMADTVKRLTQAMNRQDQAQIEQVFGTLPDISIDYALMEHASGILVASGQFDWDDLGSWDALDRTLEHDQSENVAVGNPILIDTKNCIVYNEPGAEEFAVAVVGARDLVVVVARDGILVAPKQRAQDVKDAVRELKARHAKQL